jgi:uncharacterized membrane protein
MSDDETRPIEPEAPAAPPAARPQEAAAQPAYAQPAYAMPLPAGYPAYAAQQRPRFVDQVLGMRAVIAVAIACLLIGGLSGAILGRASAENGDRFGNSPGGFFQRGAFPGGTNGAPNQQFGQGQGGR